MFFYQSKAFWIANIIFIPLLTVVGNHGIKIMTSVYKTEFGNGVVIYADDYVKTGKWVFDCGYSRLISRHPLPAPIEELKKTGKLTIGTMYTLSDADKSAAIKAIRRLTQEHSWYQALSYLYSGLGESNKLNIHVFDLLGHHEGRDWEFQILQYINYKNTSDFVITAEPYKSETYMSYAKILQTAAASCPIPQ